MLVWFRVAHKNCVHRHQDKDRGAFLWVQKEKFKDVLGFLSNYVASQITPTTNGASFPFNFSMSICSTKKHSSLSPSALEKKIYFLMSCHDSMNPQRGAGGGGSFYSSATFWISLLLGSALTSMWETSRRWRRKGTGEKLMYSCPHKFVNLGRIYDFSSFFQRIWMVTEKPFFYSWLGVGWSHKSW